MKIQAMQNNPMTVNKMNHKPDAKSQAIQMRIEAEQKKLQGVATDGELSGAQKEEKRKEIQKQIQELNIELRQRQVEARKEISDKEETEKVQKESFKKEERKLSVDLTGAYKNVARVLDGQIRVLESEIRMDDMRGQDTSDKEADLKKLQEKRENVTHIQIEEKEEAKKKPHVVLDDVQDKKEEKSNAGVVNMASKEYIQEKTEQYNASKIYSSVNFYF